MELAFSLHRHYPDQVQRSDSTSLSARHLRAPDRLYAWYSLLSGSVKSFQLPARNASVN